MVCYKVFIDAAIIVAIISFVVYHIIIGIKDLKCKYWAIPLAAFGVLVVMLYGAICLAVLHIAIFATPSECIKYENLFELTQPLTVKVK